jgi:DNA-directed RNA polymerase subunit RPC12/RpoP
MLAIQSPRGETVHITSLSSPGKTACGKACDGWRVAPVARNQVRRRDVDCLACKARVFFKVQPKGRR